MTFRTSIQIIAIACVVFVGSARIHTAESIEGDSRIGFTIKADDIAMAVSPYFGGRILSFHNGPGDNLLNPPNGNVYSFGGSCWVSPQTWKWPPAPAMDREAFALGRVGGSVVGTSATIPEHGVVIEKRFEPQAHKQGIGVTYHIRNVSDRALSYAAWELVRLRREGVIIFPTGETVLDKSTLSGKAVADIDGYTIVDPAKHTKRKGVKLFADGKEGWVAYRRGDQVLILSSDDVAVADFAPEEAEIEIFIGGDKEQNAFMEMEHQSAYAEIDPGESLVMPVVWHTFTLPDGTIANEKVGPEISRWLAGKL